MTEPVESGDVTASASDITANDAEEGEPKAVYYPAYANDADWAGKVYTGDSSIGKYYSTISDHTFTFLAADASVTVEVTSLSPFAIYVRNKTTVDKTDSATNSTAYFVICCVVVS